MLVLLKTVKIMELLSSPLFKYLIYKAEDRDIATAYSTSYQRINVLQSLALAMKFAEIDGRSKPSALRRCCRILFKNGRVDKNFKKDIEAILDGKDPVAAYTELLVVFNNGLEKGLHDIAMALGVEYKEAVRILKKDTADIRRDIRMRNKKEEGQ